MFSLPLLRRYIARLEGQLHNLAPFVQAKVVKENE